jgi:hypothetical protein
LNWCTRAAWLSFWAVAVVRRFGEHVQVVGGPRACAFGGLTYELVGWRTGFRGANPPARTPTHEMGRPGQVRADTHRRAGTGNSSTGTGTCGLGPEAAVRDRWTGTGGLGRWGVTGRGGLGPEAVAWDKE